MEYRILEKSNLSLVLLGDGFQSFNAVWLGVHAEISRRIINSPVKGYFIIERREDDGSQILVGELNIDDGKYSENL